MYIHIRILNLWALIRFPEKTKNVFRMSDPIGNITDIKSHKIGYMTEIRSETIGCITEIRSD